eukprot:TRINITY_DN7216_c0_g1_i2.p1 TRINITY_DN7216_c0_g1~~TRINITY_DN7216_c0_g1_i2.p1  ORF type:complete len:182 (-),score=20.90 TRINITY_DN7216_c0_g1_i2:276-821(-)
MSHIFVSSKKPSKDSGLFILYSDKRTPSRILDEIAGHIRSFLGARGQERIKTSFRHFVSSQPRGVYIKFTATLKEDDFALSFYTQSSHGGCIGFGSERLFDYYEYLAFSDVEVLDTKGMQLDVLELASKFGLEDLSLCFDLNNKSMQIDTTQAQLKDPLYLKHMQQKGKEFSIIPSGPAIA